MNKFLLFAVLSITSLCVACGGSADIVTFGDSGPPTDDPPVIRGVHDSGTECPGPVCNQIPQEDAAVAEDAALPDIDAGTADATVPPTTEDSGTVDAGPDVREKCLTACLYGQEHYTNTPEAWQYVSLTIGGVTYDQAALLVLLNSTDQGVRATLLKQLIVALLNGTECDVIINSIVQQAQDWILFNTCDVNVPCACDSDNKTDPACVALSLILSLKNYNNGYLCLPLCS